MAAADSGIFSYGSAPYRGNLYDQGVDPRNLVGPVFDIMASDPRLSPATGCSPPTAGCSASAPFYGSASGMVPAGAKVIYRQAPIPA